MAFRITALRRASRSLGRTLPGQVVLVLQGGGALGSYQAGVYQALHEAGIEPDWIIGTSIGAINASLIAGNAPENRLPRLREFWKRMEQNPIWNFRDVFPGFNEKLSYWSTVTNGIPGFFRPNPLAHAGNDYPLGADRAGYYSTEPLEQTLTELVDFDLVNRCTPRLTVGAAHVRTSQMRYFDSRDSKLGVKHIMASGALPPAFPGHSHRRRAVLGRRHLVEHSDGGGVRRQSPQEFADLRRSYVESVGRRADHDGGGAEPAQGRPIFQPDREPYRPPATGASPASCHQPAHSPDTRGRAQQRGGT